MFGQLVIGPPGSGKSTYCKAMAAHLQNEIKRKVIIVNLDPANDAPPYTAGVDVQDLIELDDVGIALIELDDVGIALIELDDVGIALIELDDVGIARI